jgi:type I restriction enzyme, S subunit
VNDWQTMELGQIAASVDYGVTASAAQHPVGPKFLRITDIQNGSVDWEQVPWCQCDHRSAIESRLRPGDIVFARTGATTGKSFLIRGCPPDAVFASYLIRVRLGSQADPQYVHQFFQTPDYWAQVTRSARGVAQPGVNASTLKVLKVPLPEVAEQRRIAAILDKAGELRTKRCAAVAHFDALTQSIFLDLFGDPTTNPKGWPTKPLASLIREGDTINYGVVQPGDDLSEGVPLVRVGDLLEGKISHESLKRIASSIEANYKRSRLCGDEILVSCVGSIGVVALADESVKGYNIARAVARIPLAKTISRTFIAAYLKTDFVQRYFTNELRTVSQPTLNIKQLSETTVAVPPMHLQSEFDRRVEALEYLKGAHHASLAKMDALFASLQHRAFRGEL